MCALNSVPLFVSLGLHFILCVSLSLNAKPEDITTACVHDSIDEIQVFVISFALAILPSIHIPYIYYI